MELYCGIDLHSNNSYLAIKDKERRDVMCRRAKNDLELIKKLLEPYREDMVAVAVESTYNWYWLVDGLADVGYKMKLVNTAKAKSYSGMKYTDDRHDARRVAEMLALGILPEGYIYPREERGIRDYLRRRVFQVEKRTAYLNSIKTIYARSMGEDVSTEEIKRWDVKSIRRIVKDEWVAESLAVMIPIIQVQTHLINEIEKKMLVKGKLRDEFSLLLTVPGIGYILALTIMYETGFIGRFPKVGNYGSYCRCVKSEETSNNKKKGEGNRKNGNRYLSWAYSEAAHHMIKWEPLAKRYYNRKYSKSHPMIAKRALANKIARACFYILRDHVPFL